MALRAYPVADHYRDLNAFSFQRIATVIKCCKLFAGLNKE